MYQRLLQSIYHDWIIWEKQSQQQNRHRHPNPIVREALQGLPPEYQAKAWE